MQLPHLVNSKSETATGKKKGSKCQRLTYCLFENCIETELRFRGTVFLIGDKILNMQTVHFDSSP